MAQLHAGAYQLGDGAMLCFMCVWVGICVLRRQGSNKSIDDITCMTREVFIDHVPDTRTYMGRGKDPVLAAPTRPVPGSSTTIQAKQCRDRSVLRFGVFVVCCVNSGREETEDFFIKLNASIYTHSH